MFVVEFDGVHSGAVFDADAFGTVFEVGNDLALKGAVDFATEEAHDIFASEGGDAVKDQGGVDLGQGGRIFEHDIGGPFALVEGPVIAQGKALEDLGMGGVEHAGETVQSRDPGEAHLFVHEGLGFEGVLKLDKTVVAPAVGEPGADSFAVSGPRRRRARPAPAAAASARRPASSPRSREHSLAPPR